MDCDLMYKSNKRVKHSIFGMHCTQRGWCAALYSYRTINYPLLLLLLHGTSRKMCIVFELHKSNTTGSTYPFI